MRKKLFAMLMAVLLVIAGSVPVHAEVEGKEACTHPNYRFSTEEYFEQWSSTQHIRILASYSYCTSCGKLLESHLNETMQDHTFGGGNTCYQCDYVK